MLRLSRWSHSFKVKHCIDIKIDYMHKIKNYDDMICKSKIITECPEFRVMGQENE